MNSKEDLAKKYNDLLNDIYELENSVKATKHSGEVVLEKIISEKKAELSRIEKQLGELNKTVNEKEINQEEKAKETIKTSINYSLDSFEKDVSDLRKLLIVAGLEDLAYYLDVIYCYKHRDLKNFVINETKLRASEEHSSENYEKNDIIAKIKEGKQILKDFPQVVGVYNNASIIMDELKQPQYGIDKNGKITNIDKLKEFFIPKDGIGYFYFYSTINSRYNKKSEYKKSESTFERIKKINEKELKNTDRYFSERQEDARKLAQYLNLAGFDRLASNLEMLCMAKAKSHDIEHQVNLKLAETALRNNRLFTTKREYREIRSHIVTLSRHATRMMKKYDGLRQLYQRAGEVLEDMKIKKVISETGYGSKYAIENYFTRVTSSFYKGSSLGYELLDFYRDYNSKYREDEFSHRI